MAYRFTQSWKTLRPGDKYESDCFQGEICPEELLDDAIAAGVVEDVEERAKTVEEEFLTKEEVMAFHTKAPLIAIIDDDPELEVEGHTEMKLADLKAAIVAVYFAD